jgi:hypothetical protein
LLFLIDSPLHCLFEFDFIEEIGAASAVKFTKFSPDLHLEIEKADYFLC